MFTKLARPLTSMLCAMALMLSAGDALAAPGNGDACGKLSGDEKIDCEEKSVLRAAWANYLSAVDHTTEVMMESPVYENDPTGLYDLQSGMIITNMMLFGASGSGIRANRPRWGFFDTPDTRLGVDNPDTRYLSALIPNEGGQNVFKVYGNRSNSCDMIVLTLDPTDPQGGGETIEDEDMFNTSGGPLAHGENYEVYLSSAEMRDPNWLNWLEIASNNTAAVHHRHTVCNYHTERPGQPHVERVGTEGVPVTGEEFRDAYGIAAGMDLATDTMMDQQLFWAGFSQFIQNSGLPANVAGPWLATGGLGITSQLNSLSWLTIPDGYAYVLRVRRDYPGAYGSWMLFNGWGSSLQWGSNMVNGSFVIEGSDLPTGPNSYFTPSAIVEDINPQLCPDRPGVDPETCEGTAQYTTVIISNDEIVFEHPAVGRLVPHNWMTTMGHNPVYLAGRLQGVPNNEDPTDPNNPFNYVQGVGGWMPYGFLVPVAAIAPGSPALPADTVWITEDQRTAQIRERQIFQQEKYKPW